MKGHAAGSVPGRTLRIRETHARRKAEAFRRFDQSFSHNRIRSGCRLRHLSMSDRCDLKEAGPERSAGSLREEKKALRKEKLALRRALVPGYRAEADRSICHEILSLIREKNPPRVAAYVTDGTEPDLRQVLESVLRSPAELCLPRFEQDGTYRMVRAEHLDLPMGPWGIPEPAADAPEIPEKDLDSALWLVPGVAFDGSCRRLGRGKGIYDRLLTGSRYGVGVFYECQRCAQIPFEEHDRSLDLVVTEKGRFTPAETKRRGKMDASSASYHHPTIE